MPVAVGTVVVLDMMNMILGWAEARKGVEGRRQFPLPLQEVAGSRGCSLHCQVEVEMLWPNVSAKER